MPTMVLILYSACQIVSANAPVLEHFHLSDLTNIVGQRPGELLNCTYAAGRCDYRSTLCAQQSCGVMRALWRANQGQANVEDCHLLRADGKALGLQVRVAPFTCHDESLWFCPVENVISPAWRLTHGCIACYVRSSHNKGLLLRIQAVHDG